VTDLLRLNLGCGLHVVDNMVNADIEPLPGVDVVCDLDQRWPWADGTTEYILASHVFEHIGEPVHFMAEAWRVLATDGVLDVRCPYYRHPNAFTDPTHRRFATEHMWDYWIPGTALHGQYGPGFGSVKGGPRFTAEAVQLVGAEGEEIRVVLRRMEGDD
jgi:SAM-dependent methyltransferase